MSKAAKGALDLKICRLRKRRKSLRVNNPLRLKIIIIMISVICHYYILKYPTTKYANTAVSSNYS